MSVQPARGDQSGWPVCPAGGSLGEGGDPVVHTTMSVNWADYEIFHPGVAGPLNTLPRAQARRAFDQLMNEKHNRVEMLRRLVKANGVDLSGSDDGLQNLNDWFRANVQADPGEPGRLLPVWYSVVNDVALFLGDAMIERCPGLRWEFFTGGKKDAAYHRHVIMGFSQVANPKFDIPHRSTRRHLPASNCGKSWV